MNDDKEYSADLALNLKQVEAELLCACKVFEEAQAMGQAKG